MVLEILLIHHSKVKMENNKNIALSVKDLKTYFYTNNRCNKAVNGVSFDIEKAVSYTHLTLPTILRV